MVFVVLMLITSNVKQRLVESLEMSNQETSSDDVYQIIHIKPHQIE